MRLLTFKTAAGWQLGVKTPHGVVDIDHARRDLSVQIPATPAEFFAGGKTAGRELASFIARVLAAPDRAWLLDEANLELGPCIAAAGKIICVGLNYRRHAVEAGMAIPTVPVLFSKYNNTLAASGEAIPLPAVAEEYDYEAELAVVIGRRASQVSEAEALDYVLGYCSANDLSARDLQMRTSQWLLGKTLDKFLPIGPYLVTANEIPDPQTLNIRCWVNGELRQNSNTHDMIFPVRELIAYISRYIALEPGDVILTGTPEGVIFGMAEKRWLKPDDTVEVEIDQLGRLSNRLAAPRAG